MVQNNNHTNNLIGTYTFNCWARPYIAGYAPSAQVFKPDGYWQLISEVIIREVRPSTVVTVMQGEFGSYAQAVQTANTYLVGFPVGALCYFHWNRSQPSYNGNGAVQWANTRHTSILVYGGGSGWITSAGGV
ncbi:hypothetical protein D9M71_430550 [compost metagenome]